MQFVVKVVAFAYQKFVGFLFDGDNKVSCGTACMTVVSFGLHPKLHAVLNAGRDFHAYYFIMALKSVCSHAIGSLIDGFTGSLAAWAGTCCAHLTQDGVLNSGYLTGASACSTGFKRKPFSRNGSTNLYFLLDTVGNLFKGELDANTQVGSSVGSTAAATSSKSAKGTTKGVSKNVTKMAEYVLHINSTAAATA